MKLNEFLDKMMIEDNAFLVPTKDNQVATATSLDYEFYIDTDKLIHVIQNNKETAKPMNVQEFTVWLQKRWPGKNPAATIAALNKTGKFSEKEPPTDMTAGGQIT
jgi:hypothetical protein